MTRWDDRRRMEERILNFPPFRLRSLIPHSLYPQPILCFLIRETFLLEGWSYIYFEQCDVWYPFVTTKERENRGRGRERCNGWNGIRSDVISSLEQHQLSPDCFSILLSFLVSQELCLFCSLNTSSMEKHFFYGETLLLWRNTSSMERNMISVCECVWKERTGSDNNGLVTGINRWEARRVNEKREREERNERESGRKDKVEEWGGRRRQSMCNPFKYNKLLTWYTRPHHCHFSLPGFSSSLAFFIFFSYFFFIFFSIPSPFHSLSTWFRKQIQSQTWVWLHHCLL